MRKSIYKMMKQSINPLILLIVTISSICAVAACSRGQEEPSLTPTSLTPTSLRSAMSTIVPTDEPTPLPAQSPPTAIPAAGSDLSPRSFHGLVYDPVEPAPNFAAIDQLRRPIELADLRGNVVLLYFGFLNCPDACPLTLADWQLVHRQLGNDAERVRFVFMTVDPDRDTPENLAQYLAAFDEDFIGLWTELDEVESIARDYNVFMEQVESDSALGYVVNHTTLTFLIDQAGQLTVAYPVETKAEEISADVRLLLNNPPPDELSLGTAASTATPLPVPTLTVSSELHATDPATVNLAAGRPQFVELFAYW